MITFTGTDIGHSADLLRKNELVAIPTETVYGLAGNAYSPTAVKKIFETKNRPVFNPLIVHIADVSALNEVAVNIPSIALELGNRFWPGPLTMILPKSDKIEDIVTAGLPNVAVRIPNHPITLELLKNLSFPLAAPSANPFGYISPTEPLHVQNQLNGKIPYILDGGKCESGIESTVVGFDGDSIVIYRSGVIGKEELLEIVKTVRYHTCDNSEPQSPGMLRSHYSPNTPLYLTVNVDEAVSHFNPLEIGVITFSKSIEVIPAQHQFTLSPEGDLRQVARRLYSTLHLLDQMKLKAIVAERMPDIGIGISINDRLERASVNSEKFKPNNQICCK